MPCPARIEYEYAVTPPRVLPATKFNALYRPSGVGFAGDVASLNPALCLLPVGGVWQFSSDLLVLTGETRTMQKIIFGVRFCRF